MKKGKIIGITNLVIFVLITLGYGLAGDFVKGILYSLLVIFPIAGSMYFGLSSVEGGAKNKIWWKMPLFSFLTALVVSILVEVYFVLEAVFSECGEEGCSGFIFWPLGSIIYMIAFAFLGLFISFIFYFIFRGPQLPNIKKSVVVSQKIINRGGVPKDFKAKSKIHKKDANQQIAGVVPRALIPDGKLLAEVFGIIFILALLWSVFNIDFMNMNVLQGVDELAFNVGWPWGFFEIGEDMGDFPLKLKELFLDLLIYLAIAYPITVLVGILSDSFKKKPKPYVYSEKEKKILKNLNRVGEVDKL